MKYLYKVIRIDKEMLKFPSSAVWKPIKNGAWGWPYAGHLNYTYPNESGGIVHSFTSYVSKDGNHWFMCKGWNPEFGIEPVPYYPFKLAQLLGSLGRIRGTIKHKQFMLKASIPAIMHHQRERIFAKIKHAVPHKKKDMWEDLFK